MSIILENETKASSLFNYTITPFKFHDIPKNQRVGSKLSQKDSSNNNNNDEVTMIKQLQTAVRVYNFRWSNSEFRHQEAQE